MENRGPLPLWLSFTLAYLVGAGVVWLVLRQAVGAVFAPDLSAPAERKLLILGALAPLAGLAAFQLIFGLVSRRWRGVWFWLIAPLLVYGIAIASGYLAISGAIPFPAALIALLGLPFVLGLWALRLTRN